MFKKVIMIVSLFLVNSLVIHANNNQINKKRRVIKKKIEQIKHDRKNYKFNQSERKHVVQLHSKVITKKLEYDELLEEERLLCKKPNNIACIEKKEDVLNKLFQLQDKYLDYAEKAVPLIISTINKNNSMMKRRMKSSKYLKTLNNCFQNDVTTKKCNRLKIYVNNNNKLEEQLSDIEDKVLEIELPTTFLEPIELPNHPNESSNTPTKEKDVSSFSNKFFEN